MKASISTSMGNAGSCSESPSGRPREVFQYVIFAALVVACLAASTSTAQMSTPVHISARTAIHDEYGNILAGSAAVDRGKRCFVQIYWTSNQVIHPPDYDGRPHPNNPSVEGGATAIGNLVSPSLLRPGRFVAVLANPRPPQNSRIFARVFNAPTIEEASFYADSQALRVYNNDVLIADIGATINPIDPRDDDGDGLNNSWEKSLGSDPYKWDTDGDGISDHDEFLAGTDATDAQSFFAAVQLAANAHGDAVLRWVSAPGRRYVVQCLDPTVLDWVDYEDVGDTIEAQGYETGTTLVRGLASGRAMFRVRLVVE